eukprot:CAMPEP_0202896130 /NCGR_PEP_ID=MMETSP1392-20130828/5185_1 /ASSEMBLY_ACC=CAM_ASM_000868 /TAXON_ID=225041 /ORGANISM="Chlamydomonas chlamydogama, Strain SAG 11-48b" /LENGTH=205 /DNA_ID=CAMNT_0049581369 /DNA_START=61 /DNA_END=675 /DNA_ORIENTATION=-
MLTVQPGALSDERLMQALISSPPAWHLPQLNDVTRHQQAQQQQQGRHDHARHGSTAMHTSPGADSPADSSEASGVPELDQHPLLAAAAAGSGEVGTAVDAAWEAAMWALAAMESGLPQGLLQLLETLQAHSQPDGACNMTGLWKKGVVSVVQVLHTLSLQLLLLSSLALSDGRLRGPGRWWATERQLLGLAEAAEQVQELLGKLG